ncbi:hypothetical protein [Actinomadura madurae]|uniref:hypothetical protein n=1 Tax=Actinomadura madurae TaxID=1993 RepID=UPI002026977C|nr:hypothetical protein [Actinomadura madurae]MCP9949579.1 hypothetical protein [Actinomadura madurae]MCP9966335.1 hypothetical protein [Actinomadura madurae]MCP9978824.1 hypothetical protein [Actinomadura madurae]MCQ0009648.1 hypothetical protein [Actinomadura madurae]MCQ0015012.1 hypothetical protein [Actinomadura madurae]
MKRALATAAALVGAGVAVRRLRSRSGGSGPEPNRWLTVTVNQPPERFGEIPAPLAKLADHVEIRTSPAPGGKGTELAARLRESTAAGTLKRLTGDDPRQRVRRALREAKSLIETGEILQADAPPTTRPTPGGKLVGLATRRAGGEGRL